MGEVSYQIYKRGATNRVVAQCSLNVKFKTTNLERHVLTPELITLDLTTQPHHMTN